MLQISTFTTYDKKSLSLIDGKVFKCCEYCKRRISDEHSGCENFYKKLDVSKEGKYVCPYGLTTIVKNGNIITSLIIKERLNNKSRHNFINEIKKNHIYLEDEIKGLIDYSFMRDYELERYKEAIHDIRNSATYFSLMIEEYKSNKNGATLTSDEESLISLYELINFRLDVLDEDVIATQLETKRQKLHPMLIKLSHILGYKAKSRNVRIIVSQYQNNYFDVNNHLYLALFILLENSVKYALSGTNIYVDFEENNDYTRVIIKNISNKIDIDNPKDLLKKGVRGLNSKSLGSGIGLPFANELLEKTDARLDLKIEKASEEKNTFIIEIILKNA